jgi:hypothetical protein
LFCFLVFFFEVVWGVKPDCESLTVVSPRFDTLDSVLRTYTVQGGQSLRDAVLDCGHVFNKTLVHDQVLFYDPDLPLLPSDVLGTGSRYIGLPHLTVPMLELLLLSVAELSLCSHFNQLSAIAFATSSVVGESFLIYQNINRLRYWAPVCKSRAGTHMAVSDIDRTLNKSATLELATFNELRSLADYLSTPAASDRNATCSKVLDLFDLFVDGLFPTNMYDDWIAQLKHCEATLEVDSSVSSLWILTVLWSVMLSILHLVSFLVLITLVFRTVNPSGSQWAWRAMPPNLVRWLKASRSLLPTFVQVALLLAAFAQMVACFLYLRLILRAKTSVDFWAPQLPRLPGLANTTEAQNCSGYPLPGADWDSCDPAAFCRAAGWPEDSLITTVLAFFVFVNVNLPFLSQPAGAQVLGLMAGTLHYMIASLLISLALATSFRVFNLIRFGRKLWSIAKRQKVVVEEYYDVATSSYPKSLLAKPTALGNVSPIMYTSARVTVGKTRTLHDYFKSKNLTEAHFFLVALLYSHLYAFFIQFWALVALLTIVPSVAALIVFYYAYSGESPEKGLASLYLWLQAILITVVAPYLFRMLLQVIETRIVVDRTDGIVHPVAHAQLFFFQMLASLGYGQYVVAKRLAFVLVGLIIRVGEIDTQLGVLDTDTIFKSYAGLIELMRLRAEFNMKCRVKLQAEQANIVDDIEKASSSLRARVSSSA